MVAVKQRARQERLLMNGGVWRRHSMASTLFI